MEQCAGDGECILRPELPCCYECPKAKCGEHIEHAPEIFCIQCVVKEWKRKFEPSVIVSDCPEPLLKKICIDEPREDSVLDGLSESQREALLCAHRGDNMFITGPGGAGKSFIIKRIVDELRDNGKSVVITATTGSAAWLIGGTTFHRYLGCGLAEASSKQLLSKLQLTNKPKCKELIETDVVIIDEVSMFDPLLFDKFNEIMQGLKKNTTVFGGLQVILVGDLLQLGCIIKSDEKSTLTTPRIRHIFKTNAWKQGLFRSINLVKNFRQSNDTEFRALLNNARLGIITENDEKLLKSRVCTKADLERNDITRIFSRKVDVKKRNTEQLNLIKSRKRVYYGHFIDYKNPTLKKEENPLFNSIPIEDCLELKIGALVLLCHNLDVGRGLFNGTPGKIIGFSELMLNTFTLGKKAKPASLIFSAFKPITEIDLEDDVEENDGDDIVYTDRTKLRLPIVEFDNGEVETILPHTWETISKKILISSYTNLPLILRYSITSHKAQGITIPTCMIDMNTFCFGQAYMMLSRTPTLSGLYIMKYDKQGIKVDTEVIQFYKENNLL